jgi:hypothetical protein
MGQNAAAAESDQLLEAAADRKTADGQLDLRSPPSVALCLAAG